MATVIGVLPFAFSSAQLLVPRLLRRFDGNLRGVTLAILFVGETRGFILALITFLAWAKVLPASIAVVAIGVVMTMAGAATTIGGTNLLAWFGAILPDAERRFVAPRVMGTNVGLGAFLLLPVAILVQLTGERVGVLVYAAVFLLSGIAGVAELLVVRRLPKPGRVRIAEPPTVLPGGEPQPAADGPGPRELNRFLRSITLAAFGAGFGPYLSIYSISVLGLPSAFAILLSALASGASLVSATVVGGMLGRGSASRTLRLSFLMRGGSMILGLLAFPQNPVGWLVVCVVAVVASAGGAAGSLSSNERLMRLTHGPDVIRAQGRFVAGTAAGLTAGQLSNAAILAILPLGYPAFAILFTVSGLTRFVAAARAEVSATWSSSTRPYRIEDLDDR